MLNEIVKQANVDLLGRVKIAAAIIAIHNYDRTQDILQAAGEIQKNAAFQGIRLDNNQAIASAQNAYAEMDQAKQANLGSIWSATKRLFGNNMLDKGNLSTRLRSLGNALQSDKVFLPAAGAVVGGGAGALIDDENRLRGAATGAAIGGLSGLAGRLAMRAHMTDRWAKSNPMARAREAAAPAKELAAAQAADKARNQGQILSGVRGKGYAKAQETGKLFTQGSQKLTPAEQKKVDALRALATGQVPGGSVFQG